jgi:Ni,Fe-hydrogenase III large subunit
MPELSLDKNLLKETLKTAILEIIQENHDEFQELLTEVVADKYLKQQLKEGAILRAERDLNLVRDWFAVEKEV